MMKLRTSLTAAGAALVLGTAGAVLVPAMASANSTTHTLKFVSVTKAQVTFNKASGGSQDTDVNSAGKTIGFDMIYYTAASTTTANVNVTGDFSGGFLYGTGTINTKTGAFSNGKVTGGTGSFLHATGTITAKAVSKTKTDVTIKYST